MGSRARSGTATLSGITVRPATPADLPEVLALERSTYADPWAASAFAALPQNPAVFFAVARDIVAAGGRLSGYVVAWFVLDEGELANLAVASEVRRRGIGGLLVDEVVGHAASREVKALYLEVRASNADALRLYTSRNFEAVGRRKGYYRRPVEDALILRRTLAG